MTSTRAWQDAARAELNRSRRWLLALVTGLTEADLEWFASRADATCAKWHLGHLALAERYRLATIVHGVGAEAEAAGPFGRHLMHDRSARFPTWRELRHRLTTTRRLTLALLPMVEGEQAAELFRDIVNLEHEQARYVRRNRLELGRPDVVEPRSPLLHLDTDVDAPPLFHVPAWVAPAKPRRTPAQVGSIEERRQARAQAEVSRGHRLVGVGDLRAALRAFQDASHYMRTAESLTYQGWMHALLGDLERAEGLCLEAIRLDPEFGNPYNDIGTIRLQRRDITSAIQWFEKAKRARRYEPRHFPFMNLGRLYLSLGMPEKALHEFEGALSYAPSNEEVRSALEGLRRQLDEREA